MKRLTWFLFGCAAIFAALIPVRDAYADAADEERMGAYIAELLNAVVNLRKENDLLERDLARQKSMACRNAG